MRCRRFTCTRRWHVISRAGMEWRMTRNVYTSYDDFISATLIKRVGAYYKCSVHTFIRCTRVMNTRYVQMKMPCCLDML